MSRVVATPVRRSLEPRSELIAHVREGLGAMEKADRDYIEKRSRAEFDDSVNIDDAFRPGHERENRWDYLLGHGPTGALVGLEPHSAENKAVSVVIKKRERSSEHLRGHLRPGVSVAAWFWVASGGIDFLPMEKAVLQLADKGITFVGKQLLSKHLERIGRDRPTARREKSTSTKVR